ncbi:GNAT family N-acetyltransferase [Enterococcus ureasiticus]|uniref:N-acetyltransferase domain-containing protein n=1 Tax=Enterococcus ureasiticus TaxID=903984 RepID=A0A1E5GAH4_9ENTE|nr:GNAT family N-acetyltransferase [Enterococcus ureasiticus]OEG09702.1 hypothetical protein BCR21_15290 [Enterococcus ureasiticus]
MNQSIKRLSDANELELKETLALVQHVFFEFEAPDYSNEGIEQFKQFISFEQITKQLVNQELIIWTHYTSTAQITGMVALKLPSHISLLFVDKSFHKKGIARQLMQTASIYSQKRYNTNKLTLNSSPYAFDFYKHIGFVPTDTQQEIDGIIFTPMKKMV